ncbi:hypothetical protein CAL7716_058860 [Calothrix sp. PCC 7716]|nr:hypothetical protein CAL7716_058860 [Calothrix sp. PCC 7716]
MKEQNLNLVEIPHQSKIVEVRDLSGKLRVFGAWYLWQAACGIALSLYLASTGIYIKKGNYPDIELVLRGTIAAVIMKFRMDVKARKRWIEKYER